jgi:benzoyl-CoA reductase subunit D
LIFAGIDCGAGSTKAVIVKDGRIAGRGRAPTGHDPGRAAGESLDRALQAAGVARAEVRRIFATGAGREAAGPLDGTVADTEAMARAAAFFFPGARTVVDVGAEEGRAVKLDERARVVDSAVNEKCAAGAGAFVEAIARALELSVEEMGRIGLESENKIPMNAECVVFAESEVVGLIHANVPRSDISRAVNEAIAGRIVSIVRRIGVNEEVALIGGMARNPGFVAGLARQLGLERLRVPDEPEFGAALGAALCAQEAPP